MGSLADFQREVDAEIFAEIGEVLIRGSIETPGIFFSQYREISLGGEEYAALDISFDCQLDDSIAGLAVEDPVQIVGRDDLGNERDLGTYRFMRRLPNAGTESGLVHVELARQ